jgi:threonine/homoserine/homoserine lactone efflux protein
MLVDLLLKGLLIGFMVSLPIGPMGILVIQRTANANFKSGFFAGVGVALSDIVWASLAGFSVSFIISYIRTYQSYVQIFGGIVLLILGLSIFFSHPANEIEKYKRKGTNAFQSFITSLLIALSNPTVALTYIAIFAGTNTVLTLENPFEFISFIGGFFLGALGWWTVLSFVIDHFRHHLNLRILWWFNKISGSLIILLVVVSAIIILVKGNPTI